MEIQYGRKRSGIKKELTDVINEWLMTVTDEALRAEMKANVIVTGGSIASMLLGETVNDYDVYFRTRDVTIKAAAYYLQPHKIAILTNLHDRVILDVKTHNTKVEEPAKTTEKKQKYTVANVSPNAITLTDKIQLIVRFYGEPDKIHDNYDFVHATCYWDHGLEKLELPAPALECLLSRTLIYRGGLYPIASIFRVKKFLTRGWRISAGQQLKIMWQISELNLEDPKVMQEQLTGVDLTYLSQLIDTILRLEDVDVMKGANSKRIGQIIDNVFNENFD